MLENSKWIWQEVSESKDVYVEFYSAFVSEGGKTSVRISADSDYTLFINGKYAASGQYGDYEHYKIYDTIDISHLTVRGKNSIAVLVWHFGEPSSRYTPYKAGLIFEVEENGKPLLVSDENVLSRQSKAYISGKKKKITSQLGFSFTYDATKEDKWTLGEGDNMKKSLGVSKKAKLFPRPIKKHSLLSIVKGKEILNENNTHYIFDLGEEVVGLISFSLRAEKCDDIIISYGEHLADGRVRRIIGDRDFSIEFRADKGENTYTNYMLRLGCRYLEIQTRTPVFFDEIGIIPQVYPLKKAEIKLENELDRQIYDICYSTLVCSMMEHYVDCPWREQCLYAFDSRNQMLSGYYAFDKGNFEYARANLLLMSKDERADGLLSICFPCGIDLTIPSFSLYYLLALKEYTQYSRDLSLVGEINPKLQKILDTFVKNMSNGLIFSFSGSNHWNFYDWAKYCEGTLYSSQKASADVIINLLGIIALNSYKEICQLCSLDFSYDEILSTLKTRVREEFLSKDTGLFKMNGDNEVYTTLANSLAVISGVCTKAEAEKICEAIVVGKLSPCSLSMKTFMYDALLLTDKEKYAPYVISEIRREYKLMLDSGATTVWETMDGESAFDKAGSLCHGWSAIPIYYYNILNFCEF